MYFTNRMIDLPLDKDTVLLINTISSAFDMVDMKTYQKIKLMQTGELVEDENLINNLKARGYIFEDETNEIKLIEKYAHMHQKAIEKNLIRNFTICPTMGCNLRCTYCFEGDNNLSSKTLMTDGQLQTIFKFIDQCLEQEVLDDNENHVPPVSISLFGGEPLLPLNKQIVIDTLEFAKKRNIEVRIVTNGTTIKYFSEILKAYKNIIIIQITLDGAKSIHDIRRIGKSGSGTFDLIVKNVDLLIQMGIRTHLRTNINQDNIESLPELISFIREKCWVETGLVYPYVAPVLDYCDGVNNSMKESELFTRVLEYEPIIGADDSIIKMVSSPCVNYLQTFFDSKQKFKPWKLSYCEATSGGNLVFSPDGNITTCLMLAGKGNYQIGTFDETGVHIDSKLESIWTERTILRLEKCKACKYALICGGGCPMASLDIHNDIDCPVCSDIENTIIAFVNHRKDEFLRRM